jgi:signal peptidase I
MALELSNRNGAPMVNPEPPLTVPETLAPPETLVPLPAPSFWSSVGNALRELIETLILTLVIFLLIRFAVQNFRIEGYSMEPNFHDGQFLFVNKIVYMLRLPERGDVIVFVPPSNSTRDFIKRVIGVPGDRVEIVNGRVFVNGEELKETYPLNVGSYSMGPITVPPDEYFVLGDNRNYSSDSHSWGPVSANKIIGKAWVTYWPLQMIGFVPDYSYASDR